MEYLVYFGMYTTTAQTRQPTSRQIKKKKRPSLLSKWQITHIFDCAVFNCVSISFGRLEKYDYKLLKGKYVEGIIKHIQNMYKIYYIYFILIRKSIPLQARRAQRVPES